MKQILLIATIAIATFGMLSGCDSATSSNDTSTSVASGVLTGKLFLGNLNGTASNTGVTSAKVCLNGSCGNVNSDGTYSVATKATVAGIYAARPSAADTLIGTAFIIINNDTLKEIPVTSWNLPTGYMVQRNITVTTGSTFSGDSAKVVYWDNDSIAYVVNVDLDEGSDSTQYTGFIYAYYDSTSYLQDKKLFSYFARTYTKDTIKAYSDIFDVKGKSGNFSVTSGKFHLTAYHGDGYSLVPALDTIKKWADSTSLTYNKSWFTLKSSDIHGDTTQPSEFWYGLPDTSGNGVIPLLKSVDSICIIYTVSASDSNKTVIGWFSNVFTNTNFSILAKGKSTIYTDSVTISVNSDINLSYHYTVNDINYYPLVSFQFGSGAVSNIRFRFHEKN